MDAFALRDDIINAYSDYVKGFVTIKDEKLKERVHAELEDGLLWPDPMVQINPAFEPGPSVEELTADGTLHVACKDIFRFDKGGANKALKMHRHQKEALDRAQARRNFIVTTGTGSGKSMTYIVPIVDHCLKNPGPGIKAIIVYPMNALANSQEGELNKFLKEGFVEPPVRVARYTGQDDQAKRDEIKANPPDILLTNYMMLELILTRQGDADVLDGAKNLPFIVFDELHSYRGRQGSDVALLIRRLRNALDAQNALCIGTSATLADEHATDPRAEVARVATDFFGVEFSPEDVIEETLRRSTPELDDESVLASRLREGYSGSFRDDPLSSWIETELGLAEDKGKLVRAIPKPVRGDEGAASRLASITGFDEETCADAIKTHLMHSYALAQGGDETAKAFAFRLHQFISRGGTPSVNIAPPAERTIDLTGAYWNPEASDQPLFPAVFCRECGQDYLTAWHSSEGLSRRDFYDKIPEGESQEPVYLMIGDKEWDDELPQDWYKDDGKLNPDRKKWIPTSGTFDREGKPSTIGQHVTIIPKPFRFCLCCGISYNFRQRNDYSKLVSLDAEARSTATTILTQNALISLRDSDLDDEAKKVLSFTDNRQDASLQAGHFNDFSQVSVIRSGLARALRENSSLRTADIAGTVLEALDMHIDEYAAQKGLEFAAAEDVRGVMRDVLAYRVISDLKRGWRVTSPNLEQTGLLKLHYPFIADFSKKVERLDPEQAKNDPWANLHVELQSASEQDRHALLEALARHMTRELCIRSTHLEKANLEKVQGRSQDNLADQWAIDQDETLSLQAFMVPGPSKGKAGKEMLHVGPTSNFGQFVKRTLGSHLKKDDVQAIIEDLAEALARAGLAHARNDVAKGQTVYQIVIDRVEWHAGDGTEGAVDILRTPGWTAGKTNQFFVKHYGERGRAAAGLTSREHTAQVKADVRERREDSFRSAELPLLFCSPTMELGVDIAQLNVVNMRNVPPTAANYAQRSGRAGRSGQPAVVFTYCSRSSPHDQYYFRRRDQMVRGAVRPPSIDLANEELVRSHVQAVWLKAANLDLGNSLQSLVNTSAEGSYLETHPDKRERLENAAVKQRAKEDAYRLVDSLDALQDADWCGPDSIHKSPRGWVDHVIDHIGSTFEQALDRWRKLVRTAVEQMDHQKQRIQHSADNKQRRQAERLQREANAQFNVLMNETGDQFGDFYSYRYFASEGFLPGYNFPRLPISAFVPGRRGSKGDYLNRPRFIAISEFGPRSILYNEGSKYRIVASKQPPGDTDDAGLNLSTAKLCNSCGAYMQITEVNPDTCGMCNGTNLAEIQDLYRLENVVTQRVQHISSDEEERRRMGFDVRTGITPSRNGRRIEIQVGGEMWGEFDYTPSAELWRINLGEKRRKNQSEYGYLIDLETGKWASSQQDDDDSESKLAKPKRVVPYVFDNANSLILRCPDLGDAALASLQAAFKSAIQSVYSMEDRELAAEPLPDISNRRAILFFESSAGGAGVLRRIAAEPDAMQRIAKRALDLLHFEPDGTDRGHDTRGNLCAKACYDCLMSYMNQRDHRILDRHAIVGVLQDLAEAELVRGAGGRSRKEQYEVLMKEAEKWRSEKTWLEAAYKAGLELPSTAQPTDEGLETKPDFAYAQVTPPVLIYVDGSIHHEKRVQIVDAEVEKKLRRKGYRAIRFVVEQGKQPEDMVEAWVAQMKANKHVFGGA